MDFFFPPPFPLLTKPRNPLSEVKPSLQQGSFWTLFTLNIFWPAEIGGRGHPPAPPAPAPPVLRGDRRGRVKVPICLRPSPPLRPPGEGENRCLLCWGTAFSVGKSPSRRSAENFTKAQLLPRNRPVSPLFRPGAGVTQVEGRYERMEEQKGSRGRDKGNGPGASHWEAGTEPRLFREV